MLQIEDRVTTLLGIEDRVTGVLEIEERLSAVQGSRDKSTHCKMQNWAFKFEFSNKGVMYNE